MRLVDFGAVSGFLVVVAALASDLDSLDSFYRIVAFLILGVLLLLGSFLYLRFRETFSVEPAARLRRSSSSQSSGRGSRGC